MEASLETPGIRITVLEKLTLGPTLWKNTEIDKTLFCPIKKMGRKPRHKIRRDAGEVTKCRGCPKKQKITLYLFAYMYLGYIGHVRCPSGNAGRPYMGPNLPQQTLCA